MISFLILFMLFAIVFLIFVVFIEDPILLYMGSFYFVVLGVYISINGILNINNWFTLAIGVIYLGIGMYVGLGASLNLIKEAEE